MQQTVDNVNYKFIPSYITSFDGIIRETQTTQNDIYSHNILSSISR